MDWTVYSSTMAADAQFPNDTALAKKSVEVLNFHIASYIK